MGISREEIISYLVNHAGFTKNFMDGKTTEHLYGIYSTKKSDEAKFRKEIIAYYDKHPEIKRPSNYELNQMGYIKIRDLRNELGIPELIKQEKRYKKHLSEVISYFREHPEIKTRPTEEEIFALSAEELSNLRKKYKITANTQKVVNIEPAYEAAKKAREALKEKTTAELAKDIICNSQDELEFDDYQFITREEAREMYGEDIDEAFLASRGYKLEEPINSVYSEKEERNSLIESILALNVSISNLPVTPLELYTLETDELHYLYHLACKLDEELNKKPGLKK